ncbi:MAG: porin [Planctomycetota bacterium]
MTSARRLVCVGVVAWLVACAAMGQDTTDKRIGELERQILTLKKQTEEQIQMLTKQLEQARQAQEIDRRIDELTNRMKGLEDQKPEATAGYKKGFYLKSADDMFQIKFQGRVQADWWNYEGGPIEPWGGADFADTFFLRRARMIVDGHLWGKPHKFRVDAELTEAGGQEIRDGYLELDYVPWLKVRFGQFKAPFGREWLQSSNDIQFVERSLAVDNLGPDRDIGIMAHGDILDGALSYATAVINGAGPGRLDMDDHKDWAYRVVVKPFNKSKNPWLEGLEIGHNLTTGNQTEHPAIRGRTAGDVDWYNPNNIAGVLTQTQVADTRTRVGVDGAWYVGPFGLVGEYLHVDEHRKNVNQFGRTSLGSVEHNGWYVTASYLLTGEKKTAKFTTPNKNFDPVKGGWGAWEIACRIEQLEEQSRDTLFTYTYTDPFGGAVTEPHKHVQDTAFTLGVNWYLNPNVGIKFAWVHDIFGERLMAPEHEIDTVQTRFQIFW